MEALNHPETTAPFGPHEEEGIVSLIIDHPEFFGNVMPHIRHDLFARVEVQYVITHILAYHEKYQVFPTRGILRDTITRHMTVDDTYVEDVLKIIDRKSNPREIPALKDRIMEWARHRAYDLLFSKETIDRFHHKDYAYIEEVFEKARRIQENGGKGFWFFEELEKLFVVNDKERFTTGNKILDNYLDDGGPTRKEMLVWMAPTGVGKSIMLANNAISNSVNGKRVLYITLELSELKSALRALGALTDRPISKLGIQNFQGEMVKMAHKRRADGAGDIVIYELPADEVSVDAVYTLIDELKRTKNWIPDLVIIDYLELMISRRSDDNKDSYTRQKSVSTQVRGLAMSANVCVFTATQTNRSGTQTEQIDVSNIAESYGKAMPMDYLISINQNEQQYKDAQDTGLGMANLFIAKNRNGQKFVSVPVRINYKTMAVREIHQ